MDDGLSSPGKVVSGADVAAVEEVLCVSLGGFDVPPSVLVVVGELVGVSVSGGTEVLVEGVSGADVVVEGVDGVGEGEAGGELLEVGGGVGEMRLVEPELG